MLMRRAQPELAAFSAPSHGTHTCTHRTQGVLCFDHQSGRCTTACLSTDTTWNDSAESRKLVLGKLLPLASKHPVSMDVLVPTRSHVKGNRPAADYTCQHAGWSRLTAMRWVKLLSRCTKCPCAWEACWEATCAKRLNCLCLQAEWY